MEKLPNRVGEKHITNEGYEIEIIEYFGIFNCTIKFNDDIIKHSIQYSNIVKGRVKNTYHKSVCGVGYIGLGKYSRKSHPKIYQNWQDMLKRCYDNKCLERFPTYKNAIVCGEWYNLQVFGDWYEENYNSEIMQGWCLDKDILFKGNKTYSPKNCAFIPHEINLLFGKNSIKRGSLPIGVSKAGKKFKAQLNVNGKISCMGTFNTPELAFQAYKIAKEAYIKEIADKWRDKISKKVYVAMYNYKVEIDD